MSFRISLGTVYTIAKVPCILPFAFVLFSKETTASGINTCEALGKNDAWGVAYIVNCFSIESLHPYTFIARNETVYRESLSEEFVKLYIGSFAVDVIPFPKFHKYD
jgi:hypothetical protein